MPTRPPGLIEDPLGLEQGLTPLQAYIQEKHRKPIRQLLTGGSLEEVVDRVGVDVDRSTISLWRKQLGLTKPDWCGRHDIWYRLYCPECWLETIAGGEESAEQK